MTGQREQVTDRGIAQRDAVDEFVAGFAVPPDDADRLAAAADPIDDRRLESLTGQRHLEVVTHPAVDRDMGDHARA